MHFQVTGIFHFFFTFTKHRQPITVSKNRAITVNQMIVIFLLPFERFADLQPGTEYWIRLSALVNRIRVRDAPLVDFSTEACPPDSPLAPKLTSRTKNSVVLRWSAPAENGSPLSQYILECGDDTENNEQFSEVFRGRNKQFTVTKLQPSTCYSFRLAACNEIGIRYWFSRTCCYFKML